jgi:transcriptional regulator with XRE-family HTH domain
MARTEPSARFVPLGNALRARRVAARLTQVQLANALGWSHSAVADVEAGRRKLNIFEFVDYLRALGSDPSTAFQAFVIQVSGDR